MADSVDRVFVHALNTVKKLPRSGNSRPPPEDRMKLYGLYKQSMEGDVDGVMPRPTGASEEQITEARKWDSWHEQKGLTKTEAKRRYITTLIDAMHRYAVTTPEARELVSELEFVWDQIKSNQSSSSSSTPQIHQNIRPSSSLSHQQNMSSGGLQILPPMSPTEADHAARFQGFPAVGMGVQTDDDEGDDEDEHYQTMDEFDENGLPKVAVISEPTTVQAGLSGSQSRNQAPPSIVQEILSKNKLIRSGPSSHISVQTSKKASTSSHHPERQNSSGLNPHYSRWKIRVEAALTKMTAEVAALREQLDVARTGAQANITRGRFGWLKGWVAWGIWTLMKHLVIDAILLIVIIAWMRKKGDRRLEGVVGLIGGFLGEKLRLKKPDGGGSDSRTFVIA